MDINVYIDGSCINNGTPKAKAGYGVFFKNEDPRNEYARVEGKQTNNTGELTGMIRALEILQDEIIKKTKIHIYTDSEYVIKCCGSYGSKLANNDWKTSLGKTPSNCLLLQKIYKLYNPFKKHIVLTHIKAHTNLQDEHSLGNEGADRLANLSVNNTRDNLDDYDNVLLNSVIKNETNKHYISINYNNKEAVKSLGAKWDIKRKKWYYENNISEENIEAIKLIELSSIDEVDKIPNPDFSNCDDDSVKKIYLKIPFKNKDNVKKNGGRWDPDMKSWYYLSNIDKNKIDIIMSLQN
jgi:ribonuclease HI